MDLLNLESKIRDCEEVHFLWFICCYLMGRGKMDLEPKTRAKGTKKNSNRSSVSSTLKKRTELKFEAAKDFSLFALSVIQMRIESGLSR